MAYPTDTGRSIQAGLQVESFEGIIKRLTNEGATLKPYEQVVRITLSTASTFTVNLPPAVECAGKHFSFFVESRSAGAVTLSDGGDSRDWTGDYTLDATNDSILLYCDGIKWHVIDNEIS